MLVKVYYTYMESRGVVISFRHIHEHASGIYILKQYVEDIEILYLCNVTFFLILMFHNYIHMCIHMQCKNFVSCLGMYNVHIYSRLLIRYIKILEM